MTTNQSTMPDRNDEWTEQFVTRERRRNAAMGVGVFLVIALFTAAIIAYFAGAMALPW